MKSNKLKKYKGIFHNFFNRNGGVSSGIYNSLNCGIGSNEKKKNINNNLKIVKKKIGCGDKNLIILKQSHSNKCHLIKKNLKRRISGDGLITKLPGIALGILTADCAPILFYDKKINVIGAAHAGWKGSYKNIIKNMVDLLKKNGSNLSDLVAVIGPCISKKNYEVKTDFLNRFKRKSKANFQFFEKKKNRLYFNLPKYIKCQLKNLGVGDIETINKDTFEKKNNFFSARYSKRLKLDDYGRNISIIMIK